MFVTQVTEIDGVVLENPVAQNSYGGSIFTDDAAWADKVATELNKRHCLCSKHKSNDIFSSMKGLGGLSNQYKDDMNALIYNVFSSESELDAKINEALQKYGHNKSAVVQVLMYVITSY